MSREAKTLCYKQICSLLRHCLPTFCPQLLLAAYYPLTELRDRIRARCSSTGIICAASATMEMDGERIHDVIKSVLAVSNEDSGPEESRDSALDAGEGRGRGRGGEERLGDL